MGEFSPWHLLIVAVVFVVLFGAKKLPDAARSIGRSMRIFKAEIKSMNDDDPQAQQAPQAPQAQELPAAAPAPAPAPTPAPSPVAAQQAGVPQAPQSDHTPRV